MKSLVLGGTGTLGTALIDKLLRYQGNEVVCFSRDELKQSQLRSKYKNEPRLSFYIGDIRDKESVWNAMEGVDVAFLVAALKQIETGENFPEECVKTNILGTINVADAAVKSGVKHVVFSSTDKAVDPINVYGMCKGISERILLKRNETQYQTRFSVFRWGNVTGSRGSVIQSFAKTLLNEQRVYITDPNTSRFWIRIEEAVDFMLDQYTCASLTDPCIPQIKAAPVLQVVEVIADILGITKYDIIVSGLRAGEKVHESLISQHDALRFSSDSAQQLTNAELSEMLYGLVTEARRSA